MSRLFTILMLGGSKRVSMGEQLIRAGRELDLDVQIFSHELDRRQPIASIGKVIVGKRYDDEGAIPEINDLIKSIQADVILPFIDPAIKIAGLCKQKYPHLFAPLSPIEVSEKMFDKVEAAKEFERCGLPIPETYSIENLQYPAIFKPRRGSASKGIKVMENEDDLKAAKIANPEDYLIQKYIAKREEFTLDCYIGEHDGEIKCVVPRQRIETAGGEVVRTITCRIPQLISLGHKTIEALGLRGAVTLQFILDKETGEFLLMEINPRLGGGVICSICAGADIAKMILLDALHEPVPKANVWRDGALMTRYFKEVMFFNDGKNR